MILNLFKSKPTLKELIPNGFVDIHSHILPGIDDGAKNIEDSIKIISKLKNLGFSKIIGTPHTYPGLYNNTSNDIIDSYKSICDKFSQDITIDYASEYLIHDDILEKCNNGDLLTINKNYLLIEMSYIDMPVNFYEIVFELRLQNYIPILAHPERYRFLFKNFKEFYKLKKYGCLFQLNIFSLVGYYGADIAKIANKLIKNNLIDCMGTDIHNYKQLKNFDLKITTNENLKEINKIFENDLNTGNYLSSE